MTQNRKEILEYIILPLPGAPGRDPARPSSECISVSYGPVELDGDAARHTRTPSLTLLPLTYLLPTYPLTDN